MSMDLSRQAFDGFCNFMAKLLQSAALRRDEGFVAFCSGSAILDFRTSNGFLSFAFSNRKKPPSAGLFPLTYWRPILHTSCNAMGAINTQSCPVLKTIISIS